MKMLYIILMWMICFPMISNSYADSDIMWNDISGIETVSSHGYQLKINQSDGSSSHFIYPRTFPTGIPLIDGILVIIMLILVVIVSPILYLFTIIGLKQKNSSGWIEY